MELTVWPGGSLHGQLQEADEQSAVQRMVHDKTNKEGGSLYKMHTRVMRMMSMIPFPQYGDSFPQCRDHGI